jgi:ActR/RegA family two-component response regulator
MPGHETLTAASVEEPIAIAQSEQRFEVLVVEMGLAEQPQGGLDVTRQVVELRPSIAVVYTTGARRFPPSFLPAKPSASR